MVLKETKTLKELQVYCYEVREEIDRIERLFGPNGRIAVRKEEFYYVEDGGPFPQTDFPIVVSVKEAKEFWFALEQKRVAMLIQLADVCNSH